jgi:hypothetical protein
MAKYTVTGTRSVAGVAPGGVVELDGELVDHLVEVGHLAPVVATKSPQKSDSKPSTKDGE